MSSVVASRPCDDFAILGSDLEALVEGTSFGSGFKSLAFRSANPLTMLLGTPAVMLQCDDTQSLVR
jgi:hypothetical protein